jgi:hypothetical protein
MRSTPWVFWLVINLMCSGSEAGTLPSLTTQRNPQVSLMREADSRAQHSAPTIAKTASMIVQASILASGGNDLSRLHSLQLALRTILYRIDDSEREDASPWLNVDAGIEWRDEDQGRYWSETDDASAQWVAPKSVKIDDGLTVTSGTLWKGKWRWSAQHSFGERLALSPERILFTALASQDLRQDPDAAIDGEPQDVLSFTWQGFRTRLFIDKTLHLPTRVEQTRASPLERASVMLGDVRWRTDFLFYKPTPGGLIYPHQWNMYRDDREYSTTVVLHLEANVPAPQVDLPPPDAKLDLQAAATASYQDLPIQAPTHGELLQPLAPDVWEIAGNWNVLVIKQVDGLVVIECPQSGGYSERIIALLAQHFPGMRIKAVVSTTDSLWHIAGVRPYVALGIPIYVLDRNADRVTRFIERPRTIVPDRLAKAPRRPSLRSVGQLTVLGSGASKVELYPIRGHGDARMMMAFMPANGLLYGSSNDDAAPQPGVTFNAFELVARVEVLRLAVKDYVAIHTAKMPWAEFRADVAKRQVISAD